MYVFLYIHIYIPDVSRQDRNILADKRHVEETLLEASGAAGETQSASNLNTAVWSNDTLVTSVIHLAFWWG